MTRAAQMTAKPMTCEAQTDPSLRDASFRMTIQQINKSTIKQINNPHQVFLKLMLYFCSMQHTMNQKMRYIVKS